MDRMIDQEQVLAEQEEALVFLVEVRNELEIFLHRLRKLEHLEKLILNKSLKKQEEHFSEFKWIAQRQEELRPLARHLRRGDKERYKDIQGEIAELRKRKRSLQSTVRRVEKGRKSLQRHIELVKKEREILYQRADDLLGIIEVAEQSELTRKEVEVTCDRVISVKCSLEVQEKAVRDRILDLLFELSSISRVWS